MSPTGSRSTGSSGTRASNGWTSTSRNFNPRRPSMPAAKTKAASTDSATTMTLPSHREILITRVFNAPREIIFDAVTKCAHVSNWYGPRGTEMLSCKIDLRPGGAWRFVQRGPDGNEYAFSGVYREIVRPERLVQTWNFEGIPPGHDSGETLTLDEQ